jgi:glucose/arabinose dehydrogenase
VRLEITGERVVSEERLLTERKARIREVRQGPDGAIYLISGADLLKLTPK